MLSLKKYYSRCDIIYEKEKEELLIIELTNNYYRINHKLITVSILDDIIINLTALLDTRLSYNPLDIIGCLYIMDKINEKNVIEILFNCSEDESIKDILIKLENLNNMESPRSIIITKIIDYMYEYKEYKNNIEKLINIAKDIERSCYNATIMDCRQSNNPPPRNWESYEFKDIYYSSRCGTILRLLSINSQSTKEYGCTLVQKIINNEIDIDQIGFMSENDICPIAQEKERTSIKIRMGQKIDEKYSNLYKCPACKERKTTYITKQLRALDEAADIICTCLNCSHVFRAK